MPRRKLLELGYAAAERIEGQTRARFRHERRSDGIHDAALKCSAVACSVEEELLPGIAAVNVFCRSGHRSGQPLTDIRLTGGGARSALWSQVQADIYGKAVNRLTEDEAALLGAAILAGVGADLFPTIEVGVDRMVKIAESYSPDPMNQSTYREGQAKFTALYDVLERGDLFKSA